MGPMRISSKFCYLTEDSYFLHNYSGNLIFAILNKLSNLKLTKRKATTVLYSNT